MSEPAIRPQPSHPITLIRAAVLWARAANIPVRLGRWGVMTAFENGAIHWKRDPAARAVDPIGCAILHAQPEATEPYAAAAEALSAPAAWVHGLQQSLDHESPSTSWTESIQRRLYAAGYTAGVQYRVEFYGAHASRVLH